MSHKITLLPDGKGLAAGGYDGSTSLISAEQYDPTSGVWTLTGSMHTARQNHTATLLASGKVLVAGGMMGADYLSSAELYDPATQSWSLTGSMNVPRTNHTATLLQSGKVLVVGGRTTGMAVLKSAEIYDPETGIWTITGIPNEFRSDHTATLLPSGKVLVAGGYYTGFLKGVEIYDPDTGNWIVAPSMSVARRWHTATLLPNDRVLIAGGSSGAGFIKSAEQFDEGANSWYQADNMTTEHSGHTAVLLPSGFVLIAGGNDTSGGYENMAEVFITGTDQGGEWARVTWMNTGRVNAAATLLLSGKVLVAGGDDGSDAITNAEFFDQGLGFEDNWQPVISAVSASLNPGGRFQIFGSGFRGYGKGEALGGHSYNSPTNAPLVQIHWEDNDQFNWLQPDVNAYFSDSSFTSIPSEGLPAGPAFVTVFVNGIPSLSRFIQAGQPDLPMIYLPMILKNP